MAETKTPSEKTLHVGSKTLSLKPRTETGVVRQSFSHGRSKQVVVEVKKRRVVGADGKPEAAAPAPAAPVAPAATRAAKPPRPARARKTNAASTTRKPSAGPTRSPRSASERARPRLRQRPRPRP